MELGPEEGQELAFLSQGALYLVREVTSTNEIILGEICPGICKNILFTVGKVNAFESTVEIIKHYGVGYSAGDRESGE